MFVFVTKINLKTDWNCHFPTTIGYHLHMINHDQTICPLTEMTHPKQWDTLLLKSAVNERISSPLSDNTSSPLFPESNEGGPESKAAK